MKIEDLARPGLMAFGVAGLAATALLGFAAGVALSRDPEALRRAAQRMAREAARGLEQATLLAAQAREQVGDLWAEAREHAVAEVDAADFERSAARTASVKRTPRPRKTAAKRATQQSST